MTRSPDRSHSNRMRKRAPSLAQALQTAYPAPAASSFSPEIATLLLSLGARDPEDDNRVGASPARPFI